MAKKTSADELNALIHRHIQIVDSEAVSAENIKRAEVIANLTGKLLKLDTLRIKYLEYRKQGGAVIDSLEPIKREKAS
jgi:hypothetical protein